MKDKKIMVVCGGTSTEREVSLRSGKAVFEGLVRAGFSNVTLFDLKEDNMSEIIKAHPDCVFIALHGKGGEDGSIQGMLELAGIRYTGPDIATSAICMNKIRTKQILASCDIPTANFTFKRKDECSDMPSLADELVKKIGLPMVLKSPCQGSSIGVVMVKKKEDIPDAVEEIFRYGDELLAEEFLTGVELTLPVMGNDEIITLPDIEITSEREFYDYTAKYTSGLCHHIIPSRISEEERAEVVKIGEKTYRELGCRGISRIDFIIDKVKGPMVIEVNTVPGMTEMSLFPDSAKYAGISFEELVTRILSYAM